MLSGASAQPRQVVDKLVEATGGLVFPIDETTEAAKRFVMSCAKPLRLVVHSRPSAPLVKRAGYLSQGTKGDRQIKSRCSSRTKTRLYLVLCTLLVKPWTLGQTSLSERDQSTKQQHKVQKPKQSPFATRVNKEQTLQ